MGKGTILTYDDQQETGTLRIDDASGLEGYSVGDEASYNAAEFEGTITAQIPCCISLNSGTIQIDDTEWGTGTFNSPENTITVSGSGFTTASGTIDKCEEASSQPNNTPVIFSYDAANSCADYIARS